MTEERKRRTPGDSSFRRAPARPAGESGPEAIGGVISRLIQMRGYARPQGDTELRSLWSEIAGEPIASGTRVMNLRNGVLTVGVSSSPLLSELSAFHSERLLEALQAKLGKRIKDLKFKRLTSR